MTVVPGSAVGAGVGRISLPAGAGSGVGGNAVSSGPALADRIRNTAARIATAAKPSFLTSLSFLLYIIENIKDIDKFPLTFVLCHVKIYNCISIVLVPGNP